MEEASVTHVEYPACLSVRDIQPKGDSMKFPWHPTCHVAENVLPEEKRCLIAYSTGKGGPSNSMP
jgi:hypothetical protein